MSEYEYEYVESHDVAEWHDQTKDRDQWKELAEIRLEAVDYWKDNAGMWRLRANQAKNLAQDLADVLRALRTGGLLYLEWKDKSAASWHNLPQTWKDYIYRG
jgi:hypothetical protein